MPMFYRPVGTYAAPSGHQRPAALLLAAATGLAVSIAAGAQRPDDRARVIDTIKSRELGKTIRDELKQRDLSVDRLPTDESINARLRKARAHIEAAQFGEALAILTPLLQIEDPPLTPCPDNVHRPVTAVVETLLRSLPADALAAYRRAADPEAAARLSSAPLCDPHAPDHVARHLFLSHLGDDAAFRMASLALDNGHRGAARYWLQRTREHPASSVDPAELHLRLAAATVGTADHARHLADLDTALAGRTPLPLHLADARRAIAALPVRDAYDARIAATAVSGRATPPNPAARTAARLWASRWTATGDFTDVYKRAQATSKQRRSSLPDDPRRFLPALADEHVPASVPLVVGNLLYVRGPLAVSCLDPRSGKTLWTRDDPLNAPASWPPRVLSETYDDPLGGHYLAKVFGANLPGYAMTADHARLYLIEGNLGAYARVGAAYKELSEDERRRMRGNVLAAVDRLSGRACWSLGRPASPDHPLFGHRFTCAPVRYQDRLALLAEDGSRYLLVVLSPQNGSILHTQYLASGATPVYPLMTESGLVTDGGLIFAVPGNGLCICVNTSSGRPVWAATYRQTLHTPAGIPRTFMRGWRSNEILLHGRFLIVLPADAEAVLVFDRDSGRLVHRREHHDGLHAVGVTPGGILVVRDRYGLVAYDVETGQRRWTQSRAHRTGRDTLVDTVVLTPVSNRIERVGATDGITRPPWRCLDMPQDACLGTLALLTNGFVSVRPDMLACYTNAETAAADTDTLPEDPPALAELGRRAMLAQRWPLALRVCARLAPRETAVDPSARQARELLPALLFLSADDPASAAGHVDAVAAACVTPADEAILATARFRCLLFRGRWDAALRAAWDLLAAHPALLLPADPAGELRVSVFSTVIARLERTAASSPGLRAAAAAAFATTFPDARPAPSPDDWYRLARILPDTAAGLDAALRAVDGWGTQHVVKAEACLLELARFRGPAPIRAEAWERLGALYDRLGHPRDAATARRLADAARDAPDPADVRHAWLAAQLPNEPTPPSLSFDGMDLAWTFSASNLITTSGGPAWPSDFFRRHVLVMQRPRQLLALNVSNGHPAWELSLPETHGDGRDLPGTRPRSGLILRDTMHREGHAQVYFQENHARACCVLTGRRLWLEQRVYRSPATSFEYVIGLGSGLAVILGSDADGPVLSAVDLATGALRWTWRLHGSATSAHGAVLGDSVFVFDRSTASTYVLDRRTGALRACRRFFLRNISLPTPLGWLAVLDHMGRQRALCLLDPHDGHPLWRRDLDADTLPSPARFDDNRILLTLKRRQLAMIDLASGNLIWQWDPQDERSRVQWAITSDRRDIDVALSSTAGLLGKPTCSLLRLSADTGDVIRRVALQVPVNTPDTLRVKALDASSDTVLLCYSKRRGLRDLSAAWKTGFWSLATGKPKGSAPPLFTTNMSAVRYLYSSAPFSFLSRFIVPVGDQHLILTDRNRIDGYVRRPAGTPASAQQR